MIVVDDVISLWREELTKFLVSEHLIQDINFIDSRLSSLISNSGKQCASAGKEVDFPDKSLRGHEERETTVAGERSSPAIVRPVESASNLVQIVSSSHSPLPVVIFKDIIRVVEL